MVLSKRHSPVGVDGRRHLVTQGWRYANPGLCSTIPLGLEFSATFQHILSLTGKAPAKAEDFRKALELTADYSRAGLLR